ncbi:MAG: adenine phosphoribosyltransferase [Planctomycetota bacterium]|jgi:adenine phosphoribosyltransferase
MESVKRLIRDIPDFPKPGIIFKDITPVLDNPSAMARVMGGLEQVVEQWEPDRIVGVESRGFIFGAVLAAQMELPFTPIRKPGKLPYDKVSVSYTLEYGSGTLEMHTDGVGRGDRVVVIDDLLATGGTAKASAELIEKCGAEVAGFAFVVELDFLGGRKLLGEHPVESLVAY